MRSVKADYLSPARLDDCLTVVSSLGALRRAAYTVGSTEWIVYSAGFLLFAGLLIPGLYALLLVVPFALAIAIAAITMKAEATSTAAKR